MGEVITYSLVGTLALVWLGGGLFLASRAAKERAREVGGHWLRHLAGKGWRHVQSAEGRTSVSRADLWGLAGVAVFALVVPVLLALLDALLTP